jgi:xanthine dehydrogenase molybdopterin-binding subunit B
MKMTGGRHTVLADYQVGYDDSGKITALKFDWHVDAGHSPDLTFFFVMALARAADECYYGLMANLSLLICASTIRSCLLVVLRS